MPLAASQVHIPEDKCDWPRPSAADDPASPTPTFPQHFPFPGTRAQCPPSNTQVSLPEGSLCLLELSVDQTGQAVLIQAGHQAPPEEARGSQWVDSPAPSRRAVNAILSPPDS